MKIAIVTESFYPCGVLTVVEDIYDNLKKKSNFDPVYIGPSTPFNKTKDGIWLPSKLTSKTRSYYRTLFFSPIATGHKLRDALDNVELVHIHSISILTLRVILLMLKLNRRRKKKIKVIFHMHTQAEEYLKTWFGIFSTIPIFVLRRIVGFCIRNSDHVIFPTDFFKKIITSQYEIPSTKYSVWPAPVEVNIEIVEKYEMKPLPKPYLSYVGRIVNEKNVKHLIDFFVKFKKNIPGLSLVLMGDGDIEDHNNYIKKRYGECPEIYFVGQKNSEEVILINKNSLAGISFSKTEVQGLAILEQMAVGVPVIVFRNTCWEDIVYKSGGGFLLNDSDNYEAKESCLNELIALRTEKGRMAKEYIDKELNRDVRYKALTSIYNELM